MAYDGVMDDVRRAIALEKPRRLPVFACSEEFDVKWYGKYTYEEVCQDGRKMAEVWIAAIEEFDYDWAWLQVDDCFEFEPLGVGTHGEGSILRATRDYLPPTRETLDRLRIPDPATAGRMPEKLKAIRLIREHFGDRVLVEGSCAAPFSSVGLLFGLEETMVLGLSDPELLALACDFFVELQSRYIEAQIEAGAHAIWMGDCNAFSGMLSLAQYRRLAFPACRALIERAHRYGAIVHLHNSEVATPYLLAEAELGADIINCGPNANMAEVREAFTGRNCFSGNLDPIEVLMRGTPGQVAAEAERLIAVCYPAGGYLFSTGEMNPRDVPVENMRALVAAVREAGARA
ncbi:MAG: uroporphyrinogen decarboxylase family protein [Thermoguttaceae bacterium]|jgi:uroporphyrinogen decarboxylase|nr:uroporphyrinogen decarboxylase family protein [Thermoguttaceae bacterium]